MRSPFDLRSFADWLEKQPGEKEYDYPDGNICALGQYARSLGLTYLDLPVTVRSALNIGVCLDHPWTFGAALARARARLAKEAARDG